MNTKTMLNTQNNRRLKKLLMKVPVASVLAVAAVALAGCGGGSPTGEVVPTVEASGTLTYKGQPLPHYQVVLIPDNNRPAAGVTDEEGRFTLGTNKAGDGAVAGTHRVTVTYVGPPNTNPEEGVMVFTPPPEPKVKIDPKYATAQTSGLTVDVPDSGTNELQIELN